jgi:hypothetical protein
MTPSSAAGMSSAIAPPWPMDATRIFWPLMLMLRRGLQLFAIGRRRIVFRWSSGLRCRIPSGDSAAGLFLAKLVDHIFEVTDTHRICLGVFPENRRAIRAYEKVGFLAEGVARGNAYFGGVYRDEMVMAIVRSDWFLKTSASQRG